MKKVIIALYGDSESKNTFNKVVKENEFWTWNGNSKNYLSFVTRQNFGWDGKRTAQFYSFIDELKELLDKTFNFELEYTNKLIHKLEKDDKTTVLILHGCSNEVYSIIAKDNENVKRIYVSLAGEPKPEDINYDFYIENDGASYESRVLETMKKITN